MERVRINEYVLKNKKIYKEMNVVSISDIHSNIAALKNIRKFLESSNADIVCIPGDILNFADSEYKYELLVELKKIGENINTYISIGNHDMIRYGRKNTLCRIEIPDYNHAFFNTLNEMSKCTIMSDEFESKEIDDNIYISALNMPFNFYGKEEDKECFMEVMNEIESNYNPEAFNILLAHSPNCLIENNKITTNYEMINDMDLILCGHNHGGLTPIPIQNISKSHTGIVGPYSKILQKNAFGYYTNKNNSLIVNNGVTKVAGSAKAVSLMHIMEKAFTPDIDLVHVIPGKSNNMKLIKRSIKKF